MSEKIEITKEQLEELYINRNLTVYEVKEILNISITKFRSLCKQYNIIKSAKLIKDKKRNTWSTHIPKRDYIKPEDIEDLYIKQNLSLKEVRKILNISSRGIHDLLNRYNLHKSKEQVSKRIGEKNKEKSLTGIPQLRHQNTCMRKYGVPYLLQNPEIKNKVKAKFSKGETQKKQISTTLIRYGVPYYTQTQEYRDRQYITKKKNNSFNKSKPEEQVYQLLLTKFPAEDIERQYKCQLYPWPCDFYVKSLDLYIEYQGSWTHGKDRKPFNCNNFKHLEIAKIWENKSRNSKFYKRAFTTWTKSDPLKREIAKKNNLNWKEFFSIEEVEQFIEYLSSQENIKV